MVVSVVRLAGGCAGAAIAELEVAAGAGGASLRLISGAAELAAAQVVCVVGGAGAAIDGELGAALRAAAATGVPVLGVCGGAAALVALGLLDAAVIAGGGPPSACVVEGRATPFTAALPAGRSLRLGEAHLGLVAGAQAEGDGRVLLRACGGDGEPGAGAVAVCGMDGTGNVVGVAAHLCGDPRGPAGADGRSLILAALAWVRRTPARIDHAR